MNLPTLTQRLLLLLVSVASGTLQQNFPVGDVILLLTRYKLISPLALLLALNVVGCGLEVMLSPPLENNQSPAVFGLVQQGILSVLQISC